MKEKKCKICGELFIPDCPSNVICKKNHITHCPVCGKEITWNSTRQVEPCSKECRKEQTRRNNLLKYGVEHPMQSKEVQAHHRQAMLDKYGVESPLQCQELKEKAMQSNIERFGTAWALSNSEVKAKAMQTMVEKYGGATTLTSPVLRKKVEETLINKYGVDNIMKNSEVKERASNTCFTKYGVPNAMQLPEIYEKAIQSRIDHYGTFWPEEIDAKVRQTSMEHYGVDNPSKSPEIIEKIRATNIERYGPNYGAYLSRNVTHGIISNINRAFMNALNARGIEGEFEFAGIGNYKYDIVIPDQKIVIEIDPSYTHNAVGNHWSDTGLPYNYHIDKTKAAIAAGYRCIHVFDWDDWDKVINLIQPKKKIYARQCTIYKLKGQLTDEFLDNYHLQGSVKDQIVRLGLVKEGELIQVMTFGKPRFNKHYSAELLRLCTKPEYIVVGGAERLFKFATQQLSIDNIISYCDLSKFTGDVYTKLGMKLVRNTDPQEVWSRGDRKITANLLRQRGYDQLFNTTYGKGTSNDILMLQDGWLPVYDCGQAVYEYK